MRASARRNAIHEALSRDREVSIGHLASRYGVSEMTIRRDLARLEEAGRARRTRGGAVPTDRARFEFDDSLRRSANRAEKKAIAAEALRRIRPGDRIILDNGTTALELALMLKDDQPLTVITPSLAVAAALQFCTRIETILLGGVLRYGRPDLTGIVTERVLELFAADVAFQGADGIGLDGRVYVGDPRVAEVDRKIRAQAARTYVLADHTKIGKTALIQYGTLQQTEGLITDDGIPPSQRRALAKAGARVIAASSRGATGVHQLRKRELSLKSSKGQALDACGRHMLKRRPEDV